MCSVWLAFNPECLTHSAWKMPIKRILSLKHKEAFRKGRREGQGGEKELLRVGWRSRFNTRQCRKAFLLGGIILPLAQWFLQGREGPGQPGRKSMSGSGKKKSPGGSPVGTNWNWAQLQVRLHAFQMPPWNRSLWYLCKGDAWNKREIITAPWPCPVSL